MTATNRALGRHVLVDLYDCPAELLNDVEEIEAALRAAANAAGATVLDAVLHRFSPHGVTGVLVIKESHMSIHTWPEYGFAALDLFTCGENVNPQEAVEVLKNLLHAGRASSVEMHRGQPDMLAGRAAAMAADQRDRSRANE